MSINLSKPLFYKGQQINASDLSNSAPNPLAGKWFNMYVRNGKLEVGTYANDTKSGALGSISTRGGSRQHVGVFQVAA